MIMNIFSSSMMIISIFLYDDHQCDHHQGWKELLLSRFHSIVPRINFISRLLYHRHISITAPAIIIIFNMTIDQNHHDDICQICLHRSQYTYVSARLDLQSVLYILLVFADFILFSESNFRDQIRMHRSQGRVCKTHRNYICIHGSLVCLSLCILQLVHLYSGIPPTNLFECGSYNCIMSIKKEKKRKSKSRQTLYMYVEQIRLPQIT